MSQQKTNMPKTAAYIIHLKRSVARAENVAELKSRCPVPTYVHDATDGSALDQADISKCYREAIHVPKYPFSLRSSEIGLFVSHRSCWERLVSDDVDAALILEDDVRLEENFDELLSFVTKHILDLGYVKFRVGPVRGKARIVKSDVGTGGKEIVEPLVVPFGTYAQLVSRIAAEKLLESTVRFDRPIDTFLQLRHVSGQRVYSVNPSGVVENSSEIGGSTIHGKDRRMGWIDREIKRFTYRREVRRLSRLYWNSVVVSSGID